MYSSETKSVKMNKMTVLYSRLWLSEGFKTSYAENSHTQKKTNSNSWNLAYKISHDRMFEHALTQDMFWVSVLIRGKRVCVFEGETYQVHEHTHMLFRQPVEEVRGVTGQDLVIVECWDGLDALLQLL